MERPSLAQQIAQLEDVAPADFDPEDVEVTGAIPDSDFDDATDKGTARAHYVDVGPSSLRKLHESLSDPKYDGTKTSRRLVLDGSDDSESGITSEDGESDSHHSKASSGNSPVREIAATYDGNTVDASMERLDAPKHDSDLSSLCTIREEDHKKGKAISRQMALWDSLLDARIRLQKSVLAANCLPPLSRHTTDQQVHVSLTNMLEEARLLSNEIFDLQESLLLFNEIIQLPPRKRRRSTEANHSYNEELRQCSHAASELESAYHPHLVQTLDKWSAKIQAVAPSVLLPSNRNAFLKKNQPVKSAPQLIDETLRDHSKALARTRIYRGKGARIGVGTPDEEGEGEEVEVFDDTDFYHQLLRDVIDGRGDGDDWTAVQREKRSKKKVDTKASKGRKLRYEVHEKIQNFMVPVPMQGTWHEEQIDELFASLLGRGFEDA